MNQVKMIDCFRQIYLKERDLHIIYMKMTQVKITQAMKIETKRCMILYMTL